jgi:hypothetical protein
MCKYNLHTCSSEILLTSNPIASTILKWPRFKFVRWALPVPFSLYQQWVGIVYHCYHVLYLADGTMATELNEVKLDYVNSKFSYKKLNLIE